mgnify:CR=1 FL=1
MNYIYIQYIFNILIILKSYQTTQLACRLEHGAFHAIIGLSLVMFAQSIVHVPEIVTGLGGAALIGTALWSSIRWNFKAEGICANDTEEIVSKPG